MRLNPIWCAAGLLAVSAFSQAQAQGVVIFETEGHAPATLRQVDARGRWQEGDTTESSQVLRGGNAWHAPDLSHPQRVLVLLIGQNYRQAPRAEVRAMFEGSGPNSLKTFYERESGGRLKFAPFVFQELELPDDNGCLLQPDVLLAQYLERSGNRSIAFDQVFFLGAVDGTRCPISPYYSAFASLGDQRVQNQYGSYELGLSWFQDVYPGPHMASLVLHEYGHNLGWAHSNLVSPEYNIEYGDNRDLMGSGGCCPGKVEIAATRKMVMGWQAEVRRYQPQQYGQSWQLKRSAVAPMVLALPLGQVVLQVPLNGRPVLTLTLDSATYFTDGTVRRPAGIVPRLINAELPNSQHNMLYDPLYAPPQGHTEQVLSQVGSFAIPGTGLTVIVDAIDGDRSATLRVIQTSVPAGVTLSALPAAGACYHRELQVQGASAPVHWLGWAEARGGIQEAFGAYNDRSNRIRALFAGNSSLSVASWILNPDNTHTTYGFDTPKVECALQAPVLKVAQQRATAAADSCGTVMSTVSYSGTPGIPLIAQTGSVLTHFSGSVSFALSQLDSRRGYSTLWMEGQDATAFGMLGESYVSPVECPGQPVPQLRFSAPTVSADCRTASYAVQQDQSGPAGSFLILDAKHFPAAGDAETQTCFMPSALPGIHQCQLQSSHSLQGVPFVAYARTDSDSAALRGVLSCPAN